MFCPMNPPIEDSVVKIRPGFWLLGSSFVCEVVSKVPEGISKSWKGKDGRIYCVRRASHEEIALVGRNQGSSASDRVHHAGTSAAVWSLGESFVKVKAWRDGMQLEGDTIRRVNSLCSIPTPKVIFSWVDTGWNRSFLILESIQGETLEQTWDKLSVDQLSRIAGDVARFCNLLATSTSKRLETVDKNGIIEPFLTAQPPDSEPSWKPQFLGPFSSDQLQSYVSGALISEAFHLYHADLGPTNIIVANGRLVGIIDWESAAFYPKFWIGTKPLVSAGFLLARDKSEKQSWVTLLANALKKEGLPPDMKRYQEWRKAIGKD